MEITGKASSSYVSRYAFFICFLFLIAQAQSRPLMHSNPCHTSFSFPTFNQKSSAISLLGDAEIAHGESAVRISGSSPRSAGRLMYGKPIRMLEPLGRRSSVSFSSYISFSMSSGKGDGLAFVILPREYPSEGLDGQWFGLSPAMGSVSHMPNLFAVEFDSAMNEEVKDLNGNHVGIDIESLISTKSADVSEIDLILNDGTQLHAWIDYDAKSKSLEVRLSKTSLSRPSAPLISHSVDLSGLWKEDMYVGLSSSTGDSSQTNIIYSWSFTSSPFHWPGHSQPANPHAFSHNGRISFEKSHDLLGFLIALLFGAGCGAMAALSMFLLWSLFTNRDAFASTEFAVHPVDFGYEKITTAGSKDGLDNIK
eukprot:Gb_17538 [translate_table: standard]